MVERIAGLAPDPEHPGYKHFYIQPHPGGPLTSAEAEYQTPYGPAKSAWRQTGESLTIEATVPPNTTATLVIPRLEEGVPKVTESGKPCELIRQGDRFMYELEPGQYTFKVE
jgi:alpha-L-rhamnosidase